MDSKYKKYKCVKGAAKRTRMKKKKKSNEGAPKRKKQKAKWEQKI